jgi:hypothetical protein
MKINNPILDQDFAYISQTLARRTLELVAEWGKNSDRAAIVAEQQVAVALAPGASIGDVTSAAISVRVSALLRGPVSGSMATMRRTLRRLAERIPELDSGNMIETAIAAAACKGWAE